MSGGLSCFLGIVLNMETIEINPDVSIPLDELYFSAVRAGGPGGQNVNKVSTKVRLEFDLDNSPSLTDEQKDMIRKRLRNRISGEGILMVASQKSRQQASNREDVIRRFTGLLAGALQKRKVRHKTRVPRAAREDRLESKKKRGMLKQSRNRLTNYD